MFSPCRSCRRVDHVHDASGPGRAEAIATFPDEPFVNTLNGQSTVPIDPPADRLTEQTGPPPPMTTGPKPSKMLPPRSN